MDQAAMSRKVDPKEAAMKKAADEMAAKAMAKKKTEVKEAAPAAKKNGDTAKAKKVWAYLWLVT